VRSSLPGPKIAVRIELTYLFWVINQSKSVIWLFSKVKISTISMKKSLRELSIDAVTYRDIFKNNRIKLFPVLPSYLKQVTTQNRDRYC